MFCFGKRFRFLGVYFKLGGISQIAPFDTHFTVFRATLRMLNCQPQQRFPPTATHSSTRYGERFVEYRASRMWTISRVL